MNSNSRFGKLLEPIKIKEMDIRNRFVMAPMLGGSDENGFVTEQMVNWHEQGAKGGVGLIITGAICVDSATGRLMPVQPNIDDDKYIPGLSKIAQVIQKHGAKAAVQIIHGGPSCFSVLINTQPVAASPIARPDINGELPRELSINEIADMVSIHAKAALRVKEAGFDAIEIHATNRHLINSFLSSAWNRRQDQYGGDIGNRARFLKEIIEAVRAAVGKDYPIFCRISGMEYGIENGITPDQAQKIAKIAQDAGVDVIDVSALNVYTSGMPSFYWPEACNLHLSESVKKSVDVPVIIAGRNTPELGEKALAEHKADLIGMARPLLADPDLPNKVAADRLDDIIPCQSCNVCLGGTRDYPGAVCAVNPVSQRQWEIELKPAERIKNVLIIGGGPAGMEAAKDAAAKGHHVTLYEKKDKLGGQLLSAAIPPHKEKILDLIRYLTGQMDKTGIQVQLGEEVTVELVDRIKPDAVVVATGAAPIIPDIPGVHGENVTNALDVLHGDYDTGKEVIVIGGGLIGCELAHFLAQKDKRVTIIEMLDQIGADIHSYRGDVIEQLEKAGVKMVVKTEMKEITSEGVKTTSGGDPTFFEADSVVLAVGLKPVTTLSEKLKDKVPEIHSIGDCIEPRRILEAIHDGFNAALKI